MKKILVLVAVVAAMSLVGCKERTETAPEVEVVDSTVVDTAKVVKPTQEEIDSMKIDIKEGHSKIK